MELPEVWELSRMLRVWLETIKKTPQAWTGEREKDKIPAVHTHWTKLAQRNTGTDGQGDGGKLREH